MVGHERQDELRPALKPPSFSIKTLLWMTALLCVLFASYRWFGPFGTVMLSMFALSIIAHVTANTLGVRLREHGSRPDQSRGPSAGGRSGPSAPTYQHFAPSTRLREKRRVPWRIYIAAATGLLLSGLAGAILFALLYGDRAGWLAIGCGGLAIGILGGMITFLGACFVGESWHAWNQATADK